MKEHDQHYNIFVISFDQTGFEAIINLTKIHENEIMDKLCDRKPQQKVANIVGLLKLRAQHNIHRRMEVWLLKVSVNISEEDLRELAETNPQVMADLARKGEKIFRYDAYNDEQVKIV